MKKTKDFAKEMEKFIEGYMGAGDYKVVAAISRKFIRFYLANDKDINDYTATDFQRFFREASSTPDVFRTIKPALAKALEGAGYSKAAEIARAVERATKNNYILSFEDLDKGIEEARLQKYPFLADAEDAGECDSLTMGQVILYLVWLGIPRNILLELPLTAIDTKNKCIKAGREFSYANNPKMEEIFRQYKASKYFYNYAVKNGKIVTRKEEYQGDTLIRSKTIATGTGMNIQTIFNRINSNFKFMVSYLNVLRSGQFSRGYEKLKTGQLPDFSDREKMWDYFGIVLETNDEIASFQRSWNEYVKHRQKEDFG